MKRALAVLGQMILFFVTAFAGMLWRPFHVSRALFSHPDAPARQYEYDWLLTDGVLFLLLLLVGVLARRIRTSWIGTTVAFVLTLLILVLFTKIGYTDVHP